jgi:hypothetical protein
MAHFAKVDNNIVQEVIVISNDDCNNLPFPESEPVGQAFIASLGLGGDWLQTSYNATFRLNYAGPGMTFDSLIGDYGAFITTPIILE